MKSKQVFANDDEYRPNEEGDHLEQSTEEDDIERVQTSKSLRSCSKKVVYIYNDLLVDWYTIKICNHFRYVSGNG